MTLSRLHTDKDDLLDEIKWLAVVDEFLENRKIPRDNNPMSVYDAYKMDFDAFKRTHNNAIKKLQQELRDKRFRLEAELIGTEVEEI